MEPKKKYLDLKPEDKERAASARRNREAVQVDQEWLAIAEFGKHYGWQAIEAVLENKIDGPTMVMLLTAAQKVDQGIIYDQAKAVLIGVASAQSNKPIQTFRSATSSLVKAAKADA